MTWKRTETENWTPDRRAATVVIIAENGRWGIELPLAALLTAYNVEITTTEHMMDGTEDTVQSVETEIKVNMAGRPKKFEIDVEPMQFQKDKKDPRIIRKIVKSLATGDLVPGVRLIRINKGDKPDGDATS